MKMWGCRKASPILMADSNLNDLHPDLKPIALGCMADWIAIYPARKPVRITVTWRSPSDQQRAYDAGLSNAKPGQGKHEFMLNGVPASKAFDWACFSDDGNYIADGKHPYYADFGALAKKRGLIWGGDWHHPDYDHAELKD